MPCASKAKLLQAVCHLIPHSVSKAKLHQARDAGNKAVTLIKSPKGQRLSTLLFYLHAKGANYIILMPWQLIMCAC